MKSIQVIANSIEDFIEEAQTEIEIYEDPPEGANPEEDDDPYIGEEGVLSLETREVEWVTGLKVDELPDNLSFTVGYIGWDEDEDAVHGLEAHDPANVKITLLKKWKSDESTHAVYSILLE